MGKQWMAMAWMNEHKIKCHGSLWLACPLSHCGAGTSRGLPFTCTLMHNAHKLLAG